jgi:hypothetical protein
MVAWAGRHPCWPPTEGNEVEPNHLRVESAVSRAREQSAAENRPAATIESRTRSLTGFEAPLGRVTGRQRRLGFWLGATSLLVVVLIWKPWDGDRMSNPAPIQFAGVPAAPSGSPPSLAASQPDRLADPPITEGVLAVEQTWMFDLDGGRLLDPFADTGDPSDIWFEAIADSERYLVPLRTAEITMTDVTASGYRDCLEALAHPSESNIWLLGSTATSIPPGSIALDVEGDDGVTSETRFCVRTNAGGISLFWFESPLDRFPRTMIIRYRTWAANDFRQHTLHP